MMKSPRLLFLLLLLQFFVPAGGTAQNSRILSSSFASGGGGSSTLQTRLTTSLGEPLTGNSSSPSTTIAGGFLGGGPPAQANIEVIIDASWNLISVPLTPPNYARTELFPSATSVAFSYQGGYSPQAILQNGKGYWIKFGTAQSIFLAGQARTLDSVQVASGWNLVGSISYPLAVTQITSVPGGIVTSQFYNYRDGYQVSNSIDPGKGYWVKVNETGKLVFSSTGMGQVSAIRIIPTDELPPSAPGEEEVHTVVPTAYSLGQNYPNPFNPSTVIGYSLPAGGHVSLKVYNTLGNEIITLVDEEQSVGMYKVTFDASRADGGLASGVYFYRLRAGEFSDVKKLIIMK